MDVRRIACLLLFAAGISTLAQAQSMSPMTGTVRSFGNEFVVRLKPANVYKHRIRIEMKAYDANFEPVEDVRIFPSNFALGAGLSRTVTARIPFGASKERKVRVCTESIPFSLTRRAQQAIRTRICGRFIGVRVQQ